MPMSAPLIAPYPDFLGEQNIIYMLVCLKCVKYKNKQVPA